jgi:hypothetical protein
MKIVLLGDPNGKRYEEMKQTFQGKKRIDKLRYDNNNPPIDSALLYIDEKIPIVAKTYDGPSKLDVTFYKADSLNLNNR